MSSPPMSRSRLAPPRELARPSDPRCRGTPVLVVGRRLKTLVQRFAVIRPSGPSPAPTSPVAESADLVNRPPNVSGVKVEAHAQEATVDAFEVAWQVGDVRVAFHA